MEQEAVSSQDQTTEPSQTVDELVELRVQEILKAKEEEEIKRLEEKKRLEEEKRQLKAERDLLEKAGEEEKAKLKEYIESKDAKIKELQRAVLERDISDVMLKENIPFELKELIVAESKEEAEKRIAILKSHLNRIKEEVKQEYLKEATATPTATTEPVSPNAKNFYTIKEIMQRGI